MSRKNCSPKTGFTTHLPRLSLLALAVAGLSFQTQAANFQLGDVNVNVNSQLTLGTSWRMQSRDYDYVARGTADAMGKDPDANASYQGHSSSNTDDGNMNFDRGDIISQTITGSHSFSFTHNDYRNVGANLGFRYWYDRALDRLSGSPSRADMVDDWKGTTAFDDAKGGIELMDAYVWMDFDVGGRPAQAILGRHVLNWGESTFIQGGQNVANPVDVPALRRPGAEIRDALLPVTMLSGSIALDEMGAWTLEGYYQFEWQRTRADACGTFFSNNDFGAEGCGPVYYQSGLTEQNNADGDISSIAAFAAINGAIALYEGYTGASDVSLHTTVAERDSDNEPSDTGQWGLALKWYAEHLNGTEFGLSVQNVHSRLPLVGGVVSSGSEVRKALVYAQAFQLAGGDPLNPADPANPAAAAFAAGFAADHGNDSPTEYRVEFPEDLKVFSASFATLLPTGTAWSGEFTYRPDTPIQINANDVLVRGLLGNLGYTPDAYEANPGSFAAFQGFIDRLPSEVQALDAGFQKGYREFDVYQFQSTFIHDFNRVLNADNLRLIGEIGFTYVNDLPDTDEMRFGRSSIYGSWGKFDDANSLDPSVVFADNGYVTDFSWGYRLLAQLEYSNAFVGGLTLKPMLSWSHDVSGYGPEPGSQFYEGRQILGLALGAEYMNTYFANISYTHYFDTDYWDLDDRNFMSLSVGVNY